MSEAAVFIGQETSDWGDLNAMSSVFTAMGRSLSISANRISFILDLKGPSVTSDTACSASLVAVYLGWQFLAKGVGRWTLVGGVVI